MILEIRVAAAAPWTSIAGAPKSPKINTALSTILMSTAPVLTTAVWAACSLTFMMAR